MMLAAAFVAVIEVCIVYHNYSPLLEKLLYYFITLFFHFYPILGGLFPNNFVHLVHI